MPTIWYTNCTDYPDFVGSACPAESTIISGDRVIIYAVAIITKKTEFQSEHGQTNAPATDAPAVPGSDPLTIYETSVTTYLNSEQDE